MEWTDRYTEAFLHISQEPTSRPHPKLSEYLSLKSSGGGSVVFVDYVIETFSYSIYRPYDPTDPREVHQQPSFSLSSFGCISRKILMSSYDVSRRLITDKLSRLFVGFSPYEPIADNIISHIRGICDDVKNADKDTIQVSVRFKLVCLYIHDERRWIEMVTTNDADYKMIPATEESIKELEMKKTTANGGCAICLEEVPLDSEVACMPCSHMFHEECIVNWLKNSHSCPICRFKMPTDHDEKDDQLVLVE